jgi:hypothetical protein
MFPPPTSSDSSSGGTSGGGTTAPTGGCPDYLNAPKLSEDVTMPAILSTGQLYSECAYLWAVPGATLFLPPFGLVNISGVSGNVITFQNATVAQGQIIKAGTILLIGAPPSQTTSQEQAGLDRLSGFLNGAGANIVGLANQLVRWNQVGSTVQLQAVNGLIFVPNPTFTTEVGPKDNSGGSITTTPIPTATTGVTAYYDLPNLPASNLLPATFYVKVHIRLSVVTAENSEANGFKVTHGGVEIASLNSAYSTHVEVMLPVTSSKLQLEFIKLLNRAGCYARVRIIGYFI